MNDVAAIITAPAMAMIAQVPVAISRITNTERIIEMIKRVIRSKEPMFCIIMVKCLVKHYDTKLIRSKSKVRDKSHIREILFR